MTVQGDDWRPAASLERLRARAALLASVRAFFSARGVLEVETPVLGRFGVSEPHLHSVSVTSVFDGEGFLQTSPEYHMKRLLAAGSGPIYQIARVFRGDEQGGRHNPEFSLLEWYRPGFGMEQLMEEVADLVVGVLGCERPSVRDCRELYRTLADVDPWEDGDAELVEAASEFSGVVQEQISRGDALDLLMSFCIEPALAEQGPVFVVNYPPEQAALARRDLHQGYTVARRFELYVQGLELCNGYQELADAKEQRERFAEDNRLRQSLERRPMEADSRLIAALSHGLPECSGVALGLDRLLMLLVGASSISEVLAFPADRA